jgi:chromosome segregation ATPase
MINKISDEWEKLGGGLGRGTTEDLDLGELLQAVRGVQASLRHMSQVSVTRTTLREAIAEALPGVLRERGGDLLPDLVELRARVPGSPVESAGAEATASAVEGLARRIEGLEAELRFSVAFRMDALSRRVEDLAARVDELGTRLGAVDERVGEVNFRAAGVEGLAGAADESVGLLDRQWRGEFDGLAAAQSRLAGDLEGLRAEVDGDLRVGLDRVGEKVLGVRTDLENMVKSVEASIPAAIQARTEEVEARLRKEIEEMVQLVVGKIEEMREAMSRVEGLLGQEDIRSFAERLVRLEERVVAVAGGVETLNSLAPDLGALGGRLAELRSEIGALTSSVTGTDRGVDELKTSLVSGIDGLRSMVEGGIERWESDQSHMLDRLSAIRDTVRDQLRQVSEHVDENERSIWGKITGRKEGALRLTKDEWDHLAAKLEGIVSGLESILAKRRPPA